MNWGDPIRCHEGSSVFATTDHMDWSDPDPEGAHIRRGADDPPLPDGVLGHPYGFPFRTCGYCGSIYPEDLFNALSRPRRLGPCAARVEPDDLPGRRFIRHTCRVSLGGADWKYGWPHKFYVEGIENPLAGRPVISSTTSRWDPDQQKSVVTLGEPHPACP